MRHGATSDAPTCLNTVSELDAIGPRSELSTQAADQSEPAPRNGGLVGLLAANRSWRPRRTAFVLFGVIMILLLTALAASLTLPKVLQTALEMFAVTLPASWPASNSVTTMASPPQVTATAPKTEARLPPTSAVVAAEATSPTADEPKNSVEDSGLCNAFDLVVTADNLECTMRRFKLADGAMTLSTGPRWRNSKTSSGPSCATSSARGSRRRT